MGAARVVVFGYGPLALAALDTLDRLRVRPAAVVVPGNRAGADVEMVAARARAKGVPLLAQPPRRAIGPFLDEVRCLRPDLFLVWSYSMLLPGELIAVPSLGAVNVHGGLLPEYRGGHVMNWAIMNGERETGATLAFIDEGIDTGPVIAERRFPIEPFDDAASVRDKLRAAGEALLAEWWPAIAAGTAPRTPQDEARAKYYRMRTADDGRIDWAQTNVAVCNLVRALVAPWPGAFVDVNGTRVVVRRAESVDGSDGAAPGVVMSCVPGDVRVAAGRGQVRIVTAEVDGVAIDAARLVEIGVNRGVRL